MLSKFYTNLLSVHTNTHHLIAEKKYKECLAMSFQYDETPNFIKSFVIENKRFPDRQEIMDFEADYAFIHAN